MGVYSILSVSKWFGSGIILYLKKILLNKLRQKWGNTTWLICLNFLAVFGLISYILLLSQHKEQQFMGAKAEQEDRGFFFGSLNEKSGFIHIKCLGSQIIVSEWWFKQSKASTYFQLCLDLLNNGFWRNWIQSPSCSY